MCIALSSHGGHDNLSHLIIRVEGRGWVSVLFAQRFTKGIVSYQSFVSQNNIADFINVKALTRQKYTQSLVKVYTTPRIGNNLEVHCKTLVINCPSFVDLVSPAWQGTEENAKEDTEENTDT